MRISDWSSDVCSPDLPDIAIDPAGNGRVFCCLRLGRLVGGAERVRRILGLLLARQQALQAFGRGDVAVQDGLHVLGDRQLQPVRSEEHTSELQSLMRISYAVFCLKKTKTQKTNNQN